MSITLPRHVPRYIKIELGLLALIGLNMLFPTISLIYDRHQENCLNWTIGLGKLWHPLTPVEDGQYVLFKPSMPELSYLKNENVLKQVAGVEGDHLHIGNEEVRVNDRVVVSGLPLAEAMYHQAPSHFNRDEVIPAGKLFVVGTHPLSNDSRYWGYLNSGAVEGTVWRMW